MLWGDLTLSGILEHHSPLYVIGTAGLKNQVQDNVRPIVHASLRMYDGEVGECWNFPVLAQLDQGIKQIWLEDGNNIKM